MQVFRICVCISFLLIVSISCEKSTNEVPLEIPKTGEVFARAQSMRYYFNNESGEDLLVPEKNILRPITFEHQGDSLYFHQNSTVDYDSQNGKYYWSTVIYGRKGYDDFQFFVQLSESDIDTLTVEFRYTTGADGGDGIYANIDKLYYNETLIRSGENTASEFIPENISITKNNEATSVTVKQ